MAEIEWRDYPIDHYVVIRADGLQGVALHDDPVVKHMRRINKAKMNQDPPPERALEKVRAWLAEHAHGGDGQAALFELSEFAGKTAGPSGKA